MNGGIIDLNEDIVVAINLQEPEIRPNFSGSHTFSLTATTKIVSPCRRNVITKQNEN